MRPEAEADERADAPYDAAAVRALEWRRVVVSAAARPPSGLHFCEAAAHSSKGTDSGEAGTVTGARAERSSDVVAKADDAAEAAEAAEADEADEE